MAQQCVRIGKPVHTVEFANDCPLSILCGPCAIESRDLAIKPTGLLWPVNVGSEWMKA